MEAESKYDLNHESDPHARSALPRDPAEHKHLSSEVGAADAPAEPRAKFTDYRFQVPSYMHSTYMLPADRSRQYADNADGASRAPSFRRESSVKLPENADMSRTLLLSPFNRFLHNLLLHPCMIYFFVALMVSQLVDLAFTIYYVAESVNEPMWLTVVDSIILFLYIIEISLRITMLKKNFFRHVWNVAELSLSLVSLILWCIDRADEDSVTKNVVASVLVRVIAQTLRALVMVVTARRRLGVLQSEKLKVEWEAEVEAGVGVGAGAGAEEGKEEDEDEDGIESGKAVKTPVSRLDHGITAYGAGATGPGLGSGEVEMADLIPRDLQPESLQIPGSESTNVTETDLASAALTQTLSADASTLNSYANTASTSTTATATASSHPPPLNVTSPHPAAAAAAGAAGVGIDWAVSPALAAQEPSQQRREDTLPHPRSHAVPAYDPTLPTPRLDSARGHWPGDGQGDGQDDGYGMSIGTPAADVVGAGSYAPSHGRFDFSHAHSTGAGGVAVAGAPASVYSYGTGTSGYGSVYGSVYGYGQGHDSAGHARTLQRIISGVSLADTVSDDDGIGLDDDGIAVDVDAPIRDSYADADAGVGAGTAAGTGAGVGGVFASDVSVAGDHMSSIGADSVLNDPDADADAAAAPVAGVTDRFGSSIAGSVLSSPALSRQSSQARNSAGAEGSQHGARPRSQSTYSNPRNNVQAQYGTAGADGDGSVRRTLTVSSAHGNHAHGGLLAPALSRHNSGVSAYSAHRNHAHAHPAHLPPLPPSFHTSDEHLASRSASPPLPPQAPAPAPLTPAQAKAEAKAAKAAEKARAKAEKQAEKERIAYEKKQKKLLKSGQVAEPDYFADDTLSLDSREAAHARALPVSTLASAFSTPAASPYPYGHARGDGNSFGFSGADSGDHHGAGSIHSHHTSFFMPPPSPSPAHHHVQSHTLSRAPTLPPAGPGAGLGSSAASSATYSFGPRVVSTFDDDDEPVHTMHYLHTPHHPAHALAHAHGMHQTQTPMPVHMPMHASTPAPVHPHAHASSAGALARPPMHSAPATPGASFFPSHGPLVAVAGAAAVGGSGSGSGASRQRAQSPSLDSTEPGQPTTLATAQSHPPSINPHASPIAGNQSGVHNSPNYDDIASTALTTSVSDHVPANTSSGAIPTHTSSSPSSHTYDLLLQAGTLSASNSISVLSPVLEHPVADGGSHALDGSMSIRSGNDVDNDMTRPASGAEVDATKDNAQDSDDGDVIGTVDDDPAL